MTIQRTRDGTSLQFGATSVQLTPGGFVVNDYTIDMPGEYDVGGVGFEVGSGYAVVHGDGITCLTLDPSHTKLSVDKITALEDVQLVIVSAPTEPTQRSAVATVVNELEPSGVVVIGSSDDAKVLAGTAVDPQAKVKITSTDLQGDERRVWAIA